MTKAPGEEPVDERMVVTMEATTALVRKLGAEGVHGLDIRPTYHGRDDGEISVYRSGMDPLVNEVVAVGEDPDVVAERIIEKIRTANPRAFTG